MLGLEAGSDDRRLATAVKAVESNHLHPEARQQAQSATPSHSTQPQTDFVSIALLELAVSHH
jgi:hypothetical protein